MEISSKMDILQNERTYNNVSRVNKGSSGQLVTSDNKISSAVKSEDFVPRSVSQYTPEEELYRNTSYEYENSFRDSYVDESDHFKGYGLDDMVAKYEKFYKEIDESDLSDKDKDIKKYALKDAFSISSRMYSSRVNGQILKQSASEQMANIKARGDEYKYSEEKKERKTFFGNQQRAVSKSVDEIRTLIFEYFNDANKDKSKSIFDVLSEEGLSTKKLDEFSKNVFNANNNGTSYNFTDVGNVEKTKLQIGAQGFQEMIEKYDLKKEPIDLTV